MASRAGPSPPADLINGEHLLWKMADVKGRLSPRLIRGYLITNYRCFVWDAERDVVRASVPISKCQVVVSNSREGVRSRKGGRFVASSSLQPREGPPPPLPREGEPVTIGDVSFLVDGETIMTFTEVAEPDRVKELVDSLRALGRPSSNEGVEAVVRPRQTLDSARIA